MNANKLTLFLINFWYALITVGAFLIDDLHWKKEWNSFKAEFSKSYVSEMEEKLHFEAFAENKRFIDRHNERYGKGEVATELEMNHLGDLLEQERIGLITKGESETIVLEAKTKSFNYFKIPPNYTPPRRINWVTKGAVTPVKNQFRCPSCWAFSAVGALEGQYFRKTGALVLFSEQNLVDCIYKYGYSGCQADNTPNKEVAFRYATDYGIATENAYGSYKAEEMNCNYTPRDFTVKANGYVKIPSEDENALKIAVATVGPISVSFDIGESFNEFAYYKKGIFKGETCRPGYRNHAALVVGYDKEDGKDYWLVKNSWSTHFGIEGYIKIARNNGNTCNIASFASYPIV